VDELEDGRLVVVDYKTGNSLRFGGRTGAFDGGRRLQHVLYAAAAEQLLGRQVARAEYHFPTRRSENYRARYERRALADGLAVVTELLGMAARGWYVPTNSPDDCRVCQFAPVCRARTDAYDRVDSPLAEWSREADGDAAALLRRLRR
jgi:CRISPR/Cas system-associated exonuclease Cas4 (RecB family)